MRVKHLLAMIISQTNFFLERLIEIRGFEAKTLKKRFFRHDVPFGGVGYSVFIFQTIVDKFNLSKLDASLTV